MAIINFWSKKRIYYYIFLFITLVIIFNIFLFAENKDYSLLASRDKGLFRWLMFYIFCLLLPFLLIIFYSKHIFKFRVILLPFFAFLTIMFTVPFFEIIMIKPTDMIGLTSFLLFNILFPVYLVFTFLYVGSEAYIKRYF